MERIISRLSLWVYVFIGISVSGYALRLDAGISIIPECDYLDIEEGQGNAYATSKGNCCLCRKGHYHEGDCSGPARPKDTKCTECPKGTYIEVGAHKEDMCRTPPPCQHPLIPMGGSSSQKPRCECPAGQVEKVKLSISFCIDEDITTKEADVVDEDVIAPPVNVVTPTTKTEKPTPSSEIEAKVVEETTVTIDVIDHVNDEAGEDDKPLATPHRVSPKFEATPVTSVPTTNGDIAREHENQPGFSLPTAFGIAVSSFVGGVLIVCLVFLYKYPKRIKGFLSRSKCSSTKGSSRVHYDPSPEQDEAAAKMLDESPPERNDRRQECCIIVDRDTENATNTSNSLGSQSNDSEENLSGAESGTGTEPPLRVAENNVTQDNKAGPIVNDEVGESSHCTQPRTENLPERMDQHNRPRLSAWHVIIRWKAIEIILGKITSQDLTRIGHWLIPNDNELEDIKHRCQKDGLAEVARRVFKRGLELDPKISLHEFHRTVKNMHLGYLVDVFEEHIREFEEGRDND